MKNKFFAHRFLPILSVFLFILFVFFTNVKATSDIPDIPSTIDTSNGYVVSLYYGVYYLCIPEKPNTYFYIYSGSRLAVSEFNMIEYKYSNGEWIQNRIYYNLSDSLPDAHDIYASSVDIYTDSSCSDVFFYRPPATLEEIMRVEAYKKATIQEILGVLPLILVVVVSFLGLRKALSWLSTLLRRS